jgi:predicted nucleic acid-binding protein
VYLVDSSVWIQTFRKRDPLRIESVVELEEIVTCLPVIQEVLQGFRDEAAFRIAREAMFSFQIVESPLTEEVFSHAVELFRSARRAGITVRSGIDCLIAACALRNGLTVLHKDRDYGNLSAITPLEVKTL